MFVQIQEAARPLLELTWLSWVLLAAIALLVYVAWALAAWVGSRIEQGRFAATNYVAKKSWNNYAMLSAGDWPEGAEHKKSEVRIRYLGPDGLKSTRAKLFRTTANDFPKGTIGLPDRARDDLGLDFETVMQPCGLEIQPVRPLPLVELWNHPDDSIRISTRTTAWVTLLTTATSVLTSWALG